MRVEIITHFGPQRSFLPNLCTHLFDVYNDISHFQTELIIELFLILILNYCLCEGITDEEEGERRGKRERGELRKEEGRCVFTV